MNYCKICVAPSTHPRCILDDSGICSACSGHGLHPRFYELLLGKKVIRETKIGETVS